MPDLVVGLSVDDQGIVDKQFGAGCDVGEAMNEDTTTRLIFAAIALAPIDDGTASGNRRQKLYCT
ncbi:hypothetical protein H3V53_36855 [Paraburkholderia bengalensis]|uniref:Uncharacterized protein n=1 Tax=Paraburkholderia bengalensis TaxID=2747562 RepID=A0ABU8J454_9BURK